MLLGNLPGSPLVLAGSCMAHHFWVRDQKLKQQGLYERLMQVWSVVYPLLGLRWLGPSGDELTCWSAAAVSGQMLAADSPTPSHGGGTAALLPVGEQTSADDVEQWREYR